MSKPSKNSKAQPNNKVQLNSKTQPNNKEQLDNKVKPNNKAQLNKISQKKVESDPYEQLKKDLDDLNSDLFGDSFTKINKDADSQLITPERLQRNIHNLSENILDNPNETLEKCEKLQINDSIKNLFKSFSYESIAKLFSAFFALLFSSTQKLPNPSLEPQVKDAKIDKPLVKKDILSLPNDENLIDEQVLTSTKLITNNSE